MVQWLRICLPMQGTLFDPWSRDIPRAMEQPRLLKPESPRARILQEKLPQ